MVLGGHAVSTYRHGDLQDQRKSNWNCTNEDRQSCEQGALKVGVPAATKKSLDDDNENGVQDSNGDHDVYNHHNFLLEHGDACCCTVCHDVCLPRSDLCVDSRSSNDAVRLTLFHCCARQDEFAILIAGVLAWEWLSGEGSCVNAQYVTLHPLHICWCERAATKVDHVSRHKLCNADGIWGSISDASDGGLHLVGQLQKSVFCFHLFAEAEERIHHHHGQNYKEVWPITGQR
mmetsp:Transcript_5930/g.10629  ORF Transcript_5930/g.10629 Transcript_5930/m.10629 type:complete len:232 (+) Transcript_5930:2247-2942(+)